MPAKTQNPIHVQSQKVPVHPVRQTILLPRQTQRSREDPSRREGLPVSRMPSILHKPGVAAQTHSAAHDARGQVQMPRMWPLLPLLKEPQGTPQPAHGRTPVRLHVHRLYRRVRPGHLAGQAHPDAHRPEGLPVRPVWEALWRQLQPAGARQLHPQQGATVWVFLLRAALPAQGLPQAPHGECPRGGTGGESAAGDRAGWVDAVVE
uniref:(northern house mosquito) hypothetical protein n=1 Tax=Culex pipiens TaxID=7175 RepID=A0A8D8HM48_CULPI